MNHFVSIHPWSSYFGNNIKKIESFICFFLLLCLTINWENYPSQQYSNHFFDVRNDETHEITLAEHSIDIYHHFDFENTSVLATENNYQEPAVLKILHIKKFKYERYDVHLENTLITSLMSIFWFSSTWLSTCNTSRLYSIFLIIRCLF